MTKRKKKWTLMFFFASDNILSPSMLSQIKAIKAAGYQQDTNVLLHFDPNEQGVPTRVFEVNQRLSKADRPSRIGDDGPLVSVLTSDDVTPRVIGELKASEIDEMEAQVALGKFLSFCGEEYPAEHYMLFMIGHGMIVGSDAFLPDDNPISAITLVQLGTTLNTFKQKIGAHGGVLELIGMHSCSMSGVEVAYELQGTASYMLASQGISFIGAWPYRQLLITIYKTVETARNSNTPVDVSALIQRMHELCIQHSADFMVGGYSADLCLCTLKPENIRNLDGPIKNLGNALRDGLNDPRCQELILLAHWKSQSYWQETYTDLYDYCLCLRRLFGPHHGRRQLQDTSPSEGTRRYDKRRQAIVDACVAVMEKLEPKQGSKVDGPIIRTDFVGSGTQYSHGLSIYFPWSEPVEDNKQRALTNYGRYTLTRFATTAWLEFLREYFKKTQRPCRIEEDEAFQDQGRYYTEPKFRQALDDAVAAFRLPGMHVTLPDLSQAQLDISHTQPGASQPQPGTSPSGTDTLDQKVTPPDSGGGCICPSIKNYSRDFVMSPGAAKVFGDPDENSGSNEKAA